ncbi:MAG: glycogen/starch/alpha-glucan phosphorylase, partial [Methylococcaceae bacterium]|nr:glycogen/starch/alpha-glucan phosphorylase [Methylococcaceae bacterium]
MANNPSTPTAAEPPLKPENARTGLSSAAIAAAFRDNLYYQQGRVASIATLNDFYQAMAYTVRDRLLQQWVETLQQVIETDRKVVCYFSAEFLVGPHLGNNLLNLGIFRAAEQAVAEAGLKSDKLPAVRRRMAERGESVTPFTLQLEHLLEEEEEPGLGNGGLGRLAACFMDSLASLNILAIGYGIRYEYGIFDQAIHEGWQAEITDEWLK